MNQYWDESRAAPFWLAVFVFVVSGCALPGVPKVPIPSAQQNLVPMHVNPEWRLGTLGFQAAILDIKRGSTIGAFPGGYSEGSGSFCNFRRSSVMTQAEGRQVIAGRDGDLAAIFYQTLTELGYKIVGDPTIVFERKEELNKAKYLVAARIVDMKANICNVYSLWDGRPFGTQNGEIYLEIEWSVYSTVQRAVVLTVKNSGYHKSLEERRDGFYLIFAEAFARATQDFGATDKLLALVREAPSQTAGATPFASMIRLRKVDLPQGFHGNYSSLLDSVVTVRAGQGHGSGFVVSADGYILTNAHVVSGHEEVTLIFKAGFELAGRVMRSDKTRDVALVKVDLSRATPLSLQQAKPRVGDEVVAIGTPVDLAFEKTVTRGIVSSLRFLEEYQIELIQSDAAVQPGNSGGPLLDKTGSVIGIATAAVRGTTGLNFFIPVGAALEALGVSIE